MDNPLIIDVVNDSKLKDLPNTFGWRYWNLNDDKVDLRLESPHTKTIWDSSQLTTEKWDESDVVRGVAGIHAICPITSLRQNGRHWRPVVGIVERFGRFVLGTEGWRAEHVIIHRLHVTVKFKLCSPREVAEELANHYIVPVSFGTKSMIFPSKIHRASAKELLDFVS